MIAKAVSPFCVGLLTWMGVTYFPTWKEAFVFAIVAFCLVISSTLIGVDKGMDIASKNIFTYLGTVVAAAKKVADEKGA